MQKLTYDEIDGILAGWSLPEIPRELAALLKAHKGRPTIKEIGKWVRTGISKIESPGERAVIERAALGWLYHLVRKNIKRGRLFRLRDVLIQGYADCLGYAQLFLTLGLRFGLDVGIVEVVIDNAGRYVPHYINIFTPSEGRRQFVDLWYGSKDIHHLRIGAQVKEGSRWRIKDIDWEDLDMVEDIKGLPKACIDAIGYYILGNRHLEEGIRRRDTQELDRAIAHYDMAIKLYPQNARAYFNRAVACENKGEKLTAWRDYARALKDEASQVRVLAREYDEIIQLIELDRISIGSEEQEVYLLRKGFITGRELSPEEIARQCHISTDQVERILSEIEARLTQAMSH